ncbi:MAG: TonB-dependent receptor [Candidatus Cloacimonetes bacterium]|nr:TonB-dependent receptor [Candidatus Cloacimonadota bacterium]
MKKVLLVIALSFVLILPASLFAQTGSIAGQVTIEKTGDPLPNAAVFLSKTQVGTYTRKNGSFILKDVPAGMQTVAVSFMGYGKQTKEVEVKENETTVVRFALVVETIGIEGISVVSERATERKTPVAFTDMDKEEMSSMLGSRDIPLVLTTTPSVYATDQGGGAGDARVNIRGFDQRNVAIMINGVPVNDMENGWVYWSNWDGVGDATSSIQVQRGLSAVNLATPSIGGTMNIITEPTGIGSGVIFKREFGSGNFVKTTFFANSGLISDKYAFNFGLVRKTGNGVVNGTWTDAWAYYLSSSWTLNENNKLELYAIGAPQRHGQNLYKQNIGAYSHDFAEDLDDYDPAALDDFLEESLVYNQTWGSVSPTYDGKQWWDGKKHDRYDPNFIHERENYFHKPLVNLNWYTKLSDRLNMYSILYYSGGKGGGTGTYGSLYRRDANGELGDDDYKFYYGPCPWSWDWDETITMNSGPEGTYWVDKDSLYKENRQSLGILRNSCNTQWTIGAISKAYYTINENLKTSVGIDLRTAEIDHFREVRDLLGGDYYYYTGNQFDTEDDYEKSLGDKIDYYNTNSVDWLGGHVQGEFSKDAINTYIMSGISIIKYTYVDHFVTVDTLDNGNPDVDSGERTTETDWLNGFQIKGGSSYRLNDNLDVFANVGYVKKCPIFDEVINDWTGEKFENPGNEKFSSFETGLNFKGLDGKLAAKTNFYFTNWNDQAKSFEHDTQEGDEIKVFVSGIDSRYMGIEMEVSYLPIYLVQFDASFSKGDWKYLNDIKDARYEIPSGGYETIDIYVKDLKVGDAPQTQLSFATTVFPIDGMQAKFVLKHYKDHYAAWDPFSREDPYYPDFSKNVDEDGNQIYFDENGDPTIDPGVDNEEATGDRGVESWKIPPYTILNFHFDYEIPINVKGVDFKIFAHVFNVLNTEYIQDASDNSAYSSFDNDHDADDAEVYFGSQRTFNAGISLTF